MMKIVTWEPRKPLYGVYSDEAGSGREKCEPAAVVVCGLDCCCDVLCKNAELAARVFCDGNCSDTGTWSLTASPLVVENTSPNRPNLLSVAVGARCSSANCGWTLGNL